MNNLIILGTGRSGTSMVAGVIATADRKYNLGGKSHTPDKFNEKGYFETGIVNGLNDDILWSCPKTETIKSRVKSRQGWLSTLDINTKITESKELNHCALYSGQNPLVKASIQKRILELVAIQPYLFKDPRFSYTLPVWLPYLQNCKFICVFRHPSEFLQSIDNIVRTADYLATTNTDKKSFEKLWFNTYTYILHHYSNLDMFFVNCKNLVSGIGLQTLSDFVGHEINKNFAEKELIHFNPDNPEYCADNKLIELYNKLCGLASRSLELK